MRLIDQVPSSPQALLNEIASPADILAGMDIYRTLSVKHVESVQREIPSAVVEDCGESIYLGELSPGCQACKSGTWDCLFITTQCNLACPFCCSPIRVGSHTPLSAFGSNIGEVLEYYQIVQPRGVSFSGGEPFLEFDRLRRIVAAIRSALPGAYLWVYTNGLLATKEKTCELAALGINEIRFDLAATGYNHPIVMKHVSIASQWIEHITVEIPVIPNHKEKLLVSLSTWNDLGVQYLNLHELIYEPGSPSARMSGSRGRVLTPDGHFTEFDPHSRPLVSTIMQAVDRGKLRLSVNDCSIQNKIRQVRGRRRQMGRLIAQLPDSKESMDEEGHLQTVCVFPSQGSAYFVKPEHFPQLQKVRSRERYFKLLRIPPLSIGPSPEKWFACTEIEEDDD
jgi:pyruvate formate-lyase activating enzyme-like uncharacterized protein